MKATYPANAIRRKFQMVLRKEKARKYLENKRRLKVNYKRELTASEYLQQMAIAIAFVLFSVTVTLKTYII